MKPARKLAHVGSQQVGSGIVTLSQDDACMACHWIQFAIEQVSDTLTLAERNGASKHLREYLAQARSDAAGLLERISQ